MLGAVSREAAAARAEAEAEVGDKRLTGDAAEAARAKVARAALVAARHARAEAHQQRLVAAPAGGGAGGGGGIVSGKRRRGGAAARRRGGGVRKYRRWTAFQEATLREAVAM